jgi:hypothetical protein
MCDLLCDRLVHDHQLGAVRESRVDLDLGDRLGDALAVAGTSRRLISSAAVKISSLSFSRGVSSMVSGVAGGLRDARAQILAREARRLACTLHQLGS